MIYNIKKIRQEFPILQKNMNGKPLVYLDNAATMQKPQVVIDAISNFYTNTNANIHRGVHTLSHESTNAYEDARKTVQKFINAKNTEEIVFTSGTTESLNMLTSSLAKTHLQKGDEVIITMMEHHSNMLPWQQLRDEQGIVLKYAPVNEKGELVVEKLYDLITDKTKVISLTQVSNTLGTINPIKDIIAKAHEQNILTVIDGAQAVSHMQVDVQDLNADFYVFSGHKVCGPTGIGVLYGKKDLFEKLPPYKTGGGMVETVSQENATYAQAPYKFEAGTPNIAGAIGLAAALKYIHTIGFEDIQKHEDQLVHYATEKLQEIEGVRIIGTAENKVGVVSFVIENIHAMDIGMILNEQGIAVRTGHHCTHPLMNFFGVSGTVRASFTFYNTRDEVDVFIDGVRKATVILNGGLM